MSKITTERHYRITLSNGSTYYGRTTQPKDDRYDFHLSQARKGKHENKHVQEVYNKHGYDDWVHDWLSTETGDLEHHRKIEFGYVQADPKSLNIWDGRHSLLTGKERYKQKILNETPEQKKERLKFERDREQSKKDNMTPKELGEYLQHKREVKKRRFDNMTPEEQEEFKRKDREKQKRRRDNFTPEEYQKWRDSITNSRNKRKNKDE